MDGIIMLPIGSLHPHPDNPRRDVGDVTDLAASITAQGIRQNLLVVPHEDEYRVVIGHRRLAAARVAGLAELPCAVADLTEVEQRELMIVENSQRSDLKPIEEADAYQGLLDLGMTRTQIAERTGRSIAYVRSRLRVAAIPDSIRQASKRFTQLSLTELEALAGFADMPDVQKRLTEVAGTSSWDWELSNAQRERDALRWMRDARKTIASKGLQLLPDSVQLSRSPWEVPKGWRMARLYAPLDIPFLQQWTENHEDGDLLGIRESDIAAYQPATKREPSEEELERRREDTERRAREKRIQEFDEQARDLRIAFLHDHTPFGAQLTRVIHELTCEDMLGYSEYALGMTGGADMTDRALAVYQRLAPPLPDPRKNPEKGVWHLDTESNLRELRSRAADNPRHESLLLLLARREASITWLGWTRQDLTNITDYYRHLDTLGYPVSDAEKSALEGGFRES